MATRQRCGIAVLALLMAGGHVAPLTAQSNPRIGPRDQVTVTVFNAPDLSGKFVLDAEGVLLHPLVGAITAKGLTVRELEAAVAQRLRERDYHRNPRVTVDLQQALNKSVTVTGEVRVQGPIAFAGEITLFDALVKAGMATGDAGEDVLIVRPARDPAQAGAEDQHLTVNLRELTSGNLAEHNLVLQDGDRVIVQRAEQVIITGHVNRPGAYTITAGMTVRQALALAGDISDKGTSRGLRILRRVSGRSTPQELDVKLTDEVRPGDTIVVRKSIL
jgi:polysaccharide export outer membrane protein